MKSAQNSKKGNIMGNLLRNCFTWIAENHRLKRFSDEDFQFSSAFPKKLGYKCDPVGWCTIHDVTDAQLERIFREAHDAGASVRAYYDCFLDKHMSAEWYVMEGKYLDDPASESILCDGKEWNLDVISAYRISPVTRVLISDLFIMVQQPVMEVFSEEGFTGADFMWVRDRGKYEGKQYFQLLPQKMIPWYYTADGHFNVYSDTGSKRKAAFRKKIGQIDSTAELIWKNTSEVMGSFPMAVSRKVLPDTDTAAVCVQDRMGDVISAGVLVRKKVRDCLVDRKLLSPGDFSPVVVVNDNEQIDECMGALKEEWNNTFIKGYFREECTQWEIPEELIQHYRSLYESHRKKHRPRYEITEKKAVALMKQCKKEEPKAWQKPLPAKQAEQLPDLRLLPYYRVSNGGYPGSEYHYYSTDELRKETEEFRQRQAEENFSIQDAVLFGDTADGEYILLSQDGHVIRYAMGDPDPVQEWENLQTFFYEALAEG